MNIEVIVISFVAFIIFAVLSHAFYPRGVNIFQKFDGVFIFTILFILSSRILSLIINSREIVASWSLLPIVEVNTEILAFSTWPWIFFRVWDGYLELNFIMLYFVLIVILMTIFSKYRNKAFRRMINSFSVGVLGAYIFTLIMEALLNLNVFTRDLELNNYNMVYIQIAYFGLVLIFVGILKYYKRGIFLAPVIMVAWSIFTFGIKFTSNSFRSDIYGLDLFILESIILLIVSIIYIIQINLTILFKDNSTVANIQQQRRTNLNEQMEKVTEAKRKAVENNVNRITKNFSSPTN